MSEQCGSSAEGSRSVRGKDDLVSRKECKRGEIKSEFEKWRVCNYKEGENK